jgi:hypothetical protein
MRLRVEGHVIKIAFRGVSSMTEGIRKRGLDGKERAI